MGSNPAFGLTTEEYESLSGHFETRYFRGTRYKHLPDYRSSLDRGAVLYGPEETPVCGYPKIPRALVLDPGIPEQFDGPVVVEEKLNGYNTRIARLDGEIIAFTRSGIACPFTTHVVREQLDLDPLFDERPEAVVCGETIGPENPYTAYEYPDVDSVAFRAFDVRNRTERESMAVEPRRELCERFDVPQTRSFGVHDPTATDDIEAIVEELDADDREGIVLKSPDGHSRLKYTTGTSTESDLEYAFSLPFEYGQSFVFQRLLREAFRTAERGDDPTERAHDIGESILVPMVETIREVETGRPIGDEYTVSAPPRIVEELLTHLHEQGLTIDIIEDRREGGDRRVTFRKRMRSTEDKTKAYLEGCPVDY